MLEQITKLVRSSRIPKIQLALFLIVIVLSAILYGKQPLAVRSIALAIFATLAADYIFLRLRRITPFFLSAALVSGLIIGLLALPSLPWYYPVLAGVLAIAGKNFLKSNNRHVFNPATFGLFVTGLLLHQNVSWWGVIFQSHLSTYASLLLLFILLSPAYISLFRLRKANTVISFLFVFTYLQILIRINAPSDIIPTFIGTLSSPLLLFFAFVMLPEPMTSPNNARLQVVFGAFVAVIAVIANYIPALFMPDTLLFGLLVGNLVFFKLRQTYP